MASRPSDGSTAAPSRRPTAPLPGQDRRRRRLRRRQDDLRRLDLRDRAADHRGRHDQGQRGRRRHRARCRPRRPRPWPWTSAASRLGDDLVLYLFGTPGQDRFWFMWDDLVRGAVGAVVLVDTRRLADCFPAVDYFEEQRHPVRRRASTASTASSPTRSTRCARRSASRRTSRSILTDARDREADQGHPASSSSSTPWPAPAADGSGADSARPAALRARVLTVVIVHWNQPERCLKHGRPRSRARACRVRITVVDNGSSRRRA